MEPYLSQILATLLLSLRIVPALAFAQPFTLLRVPAIVRVMLSITLAGWMVSSHPDATWRAINVQTPLLAVAASELILGIALALPLQLAFAALLTAGRTLDIQAGFGLAALVDPTTKAQMPLAGTILAYAAAAVFFSTGGPESLLAVWSASLERTSLGAAIANDAVPILIGYCSSVSLLAMGAVGIALLVLFLLDLAITFMSRTMPQMNVLVLGFQVKTLALLVMLPIALGLTGTVLAAMLRAAIDLMPQLA